MFSTHESVLEMIENLKQVTLDAQKFDEGNNSAGLRVRKTLAGIAKDCKSARAQILTIQKKRRQ